MYKLIQRIKKHEGYRSTPYKDHLGHETIGYGFKVSSLSLSRRACDVIIDDYICKMIPKVDLAFPWLSRIHEDAQDVVYEMCYQMGLRGFSKFKITIALLKEEKYHKAGEEMLDSKWASQTPERAFVLSNVLKGIPK